MTHSYPPGSHPVGLVLAGGGMRGAYEVGVLQGIIDVLALGPEASSPFQFVAGTSVGAINSAFIAANAHRTDLGLATLTGAWCGLRFGHDVRSRVGVWLEQLMRGTAPPNASDVYLGSSLFDPEPLEDLVTATIDWEQLHRNIENERISGLLIAALEVASGRTTIFHELSSKLTFAASKDPRQLARRERLNASHVLASAAIPLLFPARRIGDDFYCDGGLRFNTPIAPVIRSGARRVVVVSTARRARRLRSKPNVKIQYYPTAGFLLGKVLNALLLDPLDYDLHMLQRINRLLELHSRSLDESGQLAADELFTETRGTSYRPIDILVFSPSRDIGRMAREYLRNNFESLDIGWIMRWFLRGATEPGSGSDWVAYLLFDGGFAKELIDLGRRDVHRRKEEVRRFFGLGDLAGRQPSMAVDFVL